MPELRNPEESDYILRTTPKAKLFKLGAVVTGMGVASVGVGIVDSVIDEGEILNNIGVGAGYLAISIGALTMLSSAIRTVNQYDRDKNDNPNEQLKLF